jgi:hypothetical protein
MIMKMDPSVLQPFKFNPLEAGRAEPDFIVQLLEQFVGAKLSAEKNTSILTISSELPQGAGMRDLYEAIQVQEAASLGITVEEYEALSPVLEALQGILTQRDHAALFEQAADAQGKSLYPHARPSRGLFVASIFEISHLFRQPTTCASIIPVTEGAHRAELGYFDGDWVTQ